MKKKQDDDDENTMDDANIGINNENIEDEEEDHPPLRCGSLPNQTKGSCFCPSRPFLISCLTSRRRTAPLAVVIHANVSCRR